MDDKRETPLTDEVLTHNEGYANYQRDELATLARSLERALQKCEQAREALERKYQDEAAIVNRIWAMFGTPSYDELKGRSIYDLIDELRQAREAKRRERVYWQLRCEQAEARNVEMHGKTAEMVGMERDIERRAREELEHLNSAQADNLRKEREAREAAEGRAVELEHHIRNVAPSEADL